MRTLLTALLLAVCTSIAFAHEKGAIHIAKPEVDVGGTVTIKGERLSRNARFKFELRGALNTYTLSEVTSDAKGAFTTELTLPAEAEAGVYSLVLIASDGDVSARADLTIAPTQAMSSDEHAGMDHSGMDMDHSGMDMAAPHASAEMMKLDTRTSGGEWTAILAISALCIAGGLALLRSSSRA